MKTKKLTIWVMVLLVMFLRFPAAQAYFDFDSGNTEIIDYYINDAVRVDFHIANVPGTHLILENGAYGLNAYNNSQITVNGGIIEDRVNGYGNSQITINDGIVEDRVNGYGNSRLTISGGTLIGDAVSWDNSQVVIAGNANVPFVLADNNGNIHINGGTINWCIEAYANSSIYISGGTFTDNIYAIENGIITLEGKNFKVGNVNVMGFLNIPYLVSVGALTDNSGGSYNQYNGVLTGELADGTVLSNTIEIMHHPKDTVFMNGANFNFIAIPEPATLLLLGLGVPILSGLKKKR